VRRGNTQEQNTAETSGTPKDDLSFCSIFVMFFVDFILGTFKSTLLPSV